MGDIRETEPVKLFVSVLTSVPEILPRVEHDLVLRYGPVDIRGGPFPFDKTRYYDIDMGAPLLRTILGFAGLIEPERLAQIKRETNAQEEAMAAEASRIRRPVNLDPGYIESSKLVLASTKNFYHRICVGNGIFAEVTMHWQACAWQKFDWTFPDFRSGQYDAFFTALRRAYRDQLKGLRS
jgi:hypothetical protein